MADGPLGPFVVASNSTVLAGSAPGAGMGDFNMLVGQAGRGGLPQTLSREPSRTAVEHQVDTDGVAYHVRHDSGRHYLPVTRLAADYLSAGRGYARGVRGPRLLQARRPLRTLPCSRPAHRHKLHRVSPNPPGHLQAANRESQSKKLGQVARFAPVLKLLPPRPVGPAVHPRRAGLLCVPGRLQRLRLLKPRPPRPLRSPGPPGASARPQPCP